MRIVQLQKITDRKYKVCLEDGTVFPLYAGEVRRYGLREGEELEESVFSQLWEEVLTKRAKLRCLHLLQSMDRTEAEIRGRLKRDGYPEELIDRAVRYAASYRYIDDRRYARTYVLQQTGRKSSRDIRSHLLQKGIDQEIVRETLDEFFCETETGEDPDAEVIRTYARKRRYDPENASPEETGKFLRFLMRKGFRLSEIRKALGDGLRTDF